VFHDALGARQAVTTALGTVYSSSKVTVIEIAKEEA